jgi:hypothetical protein
MPANENAYNTAQTDYDNLKTDLSNGVAVSQSDIQTAAQAVSDANKTKNQALYSMVGSSISAAVIWWWNIRDMKQSNSDHATTTQPITFGINKTGQVQISLSLD